MPPRLNREGIPEPTRRGRSMKNRIAAYLPRHAPRVKPFEPPQLQSIIDETRAFSLLVEQTKQGNGTAVLLLDLLFGEDALGNATAA
jgi:hypothetical protein